MSSGSSRATNAASAADVPRPARPNCCHSDERGPGPPAPEGPRLVQGVSESGYESRVWTSPSPDGLVHPVRGAWDADAGMTGRRLRAQGLWGAAPTFGAHKAMAKPSHAPPSRRRAGRERLCGILRSSALRDIFMIWALLAGAPAPPRVTRATSPHPAPIVSGGRLCAPVRQREIPTLGLPCVARDGVWMP